jgi:hypothetical protein
LPISALDAIPLAFEHTRQQLFTRFRLGQWTRLAFVGLLAGELGSGGGSNFNLGKLTNPQPGGSPHFPANLTPILLALGAVLVVLVFAALVFGIVMMYVSSVMRFILFDSVLAKECHIRLGWQRRQRPGGRLFLWSLLCIFATFGGLTLLVGIPAAFAFAVGWLRAPKEHIIPLVLCGILLFFVLVIFFVAISLVYVLTKDFVVPQMALEDIGAIEAWRRLWPMLKTEMWSYAGYIGMKMVMAIGAGMAIGLVTVILGLVMAIPAVALGILAVLTGQSAGLTWNAYTITLAIVVGTVLLSIFFYLVSLISVPALVFFPAYSIYFFAARYGPLYSALYPAVVPGALPATRLPDLPPLPPAPAPTG